MFCRPAALYVLLRIQVYKTAIKYGRLKGFTLYSRAWSYQRDLSAIPGIAMPDQLTSQAVCFADLRCSMVHFVAEQTQPPADGSHSRLAPLEVTAASREDVPAGMQLRDAVRDPEHRDKFFKPAARLLGEMVCCS